jgi:hypothetical protein
MYIFKSCYPVALVGLRSKDLRAVDMEITAFIHMMPCSATKLHGVTSQKTVILMHLFACLSNWGPRSK